MLRTPLCLCVCVCGAGGVAGGSTAQGANEGWKTSFSLHCVNGWSCTRRWLTDLSVCLYGCLAALTGLFDGWTTDGRGHPVNNHTHTHTCMHSECSSRPRQYINSIRWVDVTCVHHSLTHAATHTHTHMRSPKSQTRHVRSGHVAPLHPSIHPCGRPSRN